VLVIALGVAGCDSDKDLARHGDAARNVAKLPLEAKSNEIRTIAPRFPELEMFVNNRKFGGSNGCSSTFPMNPGPEHPDASQLAVEHSMICGHPGAVSKVTWSYLRTDARGDHLRLERNFPYGETHADTSFVEIVFSGDEVTPFEDEFQRIIVRAPIQSNGANP
jgi:hypothetical protein